MYLEIDPESFYSGESRPLIHPELGKGNIIPSLITLTLSHYVLCARCFKHHPPVEDSIPHNHMTHLILTNDSYRSEAELEKQVPVGLLLIHGGVSATKYFCEAIHRAEPIFIFKHTGSAADLGALRSLYVHVLIAMYTYGIYADYVHCVCM